MLGSEDCSGDKQKESDFPYTTRAEGLVRLITAHFALLVPNV